MTIKINKFYKNNGRTTMMPEYLIPVSLYVEEEGQDYSIYKDSKDDLLYNVWDVSSGEMCVYAMSRLSRYMELMGDGK